MQPTTLERARRILAEHTGKSMVGDRRWLDNQVNAIRRAEWKNEASRFLKFKDDGCVCAECYEDICSPCGRSFVGITLPQNVVGLHYLEARGRRIDMTSVRLGSTGCCSPCGCLKAEILINKAPLLRQIPPGYKGVIVFKGKDANDKGKRIGVEYVVRGSSSIRREDVTLSLSGTETAYSPSRFTMITFPERCGWIDVQTQEGYSLGSYHPSITAPSHLRVRISGISKGDHVNWEGFREPHDVIFDSDRVEWDDPLDWVNLHIWLELHTKTTKSPSEQQTYLATAAVARAGAESELAATQPIPHAHLRPNGPGSLRRKIRAFNRY